MHLARASAHAVFYADTPAREVALVIDQPLSVYRYAVVSHVVISQYDHSGPPPLPAATVAFGQGCGCHDPARPLVEPAFLEKPALDLIVWLGRVVAHVGQGVPQCNRDCTDQPHP